MTPTSAVKPISLALWRLTVMAEAISSAEQSAKKSPRMLPVPMPSNTMISTPTIITAMVTSVTGRGRSLRNIHDSSAANMVVKARMKTRLAVDVL